MSDENETNETPRRGRPPRAAEEAQRRRKREDTSGFRTRLWYDPSKMDFKNFHYYFAEGTDQRIRELTVHDDYDIVKDEGTEQFQQHYAGVDATNARQNQVLLKKPKHFNEEDQAKKDKRRDALMEEVKGGKPLGQEDEGLSDKHSYVPRHVENNLDRN